MEYFQLVTQLSQAQAAAFVLDMRHQRSTSSGQPPTVDQMVETYFEKLESGGSLKNLLDIVETSATPFTDPPARPAAGWV